MSPAAGRVVSQKMNFWGQGNKGRLTSSAVRRRTDEYPPARLLLSGGLEPQSPVQLWCGPGDRTALRPGPGAAGHQTRRGLQSIFTDSTLRVSLVRVPVTRALMALAVFPVRQ